MRQQSSKYFAHRHPSSHNRMAWGQNLTFSEHDHIAYQIKGNYECRIMVANILPADPPPP